MIIKRLLKDTRSLGESIAALKLHLHMPKSHIRSGLKDLLEFALIAMRTLHFPIRRGHKSDLKNLEFKVHPSLNGASARFHIEHERDIVDSQNPINARFKKSYILYSSQIEGVLKKLEHKHHRYVKSIIVHELVHYLQPHYSEDSQTTNINTLEEKLEREDEFQAHLIMALYYFNIDLKFPPKDKETQLSIIHRYTQEFPHP